MDNNVPAPPSIDFLLVQVVIDALHAVRHLKSSNYTYQQKLGEIQKRVEDLTGHTPQFTESFCPNVATHGFDPVPTFDANDERLRLVTVTFPSLPGYDIYKSLCVDSLDQTVTMGDKHDDIFAIRQVLTPDAESDALTFGISWKPPDSDSQTLHPIIYRGSDRRLTCRFAPGTPRRTLVSWIRFLRLLGPHVRVFTHLSFFKSQLL